MKSKAQKRKEALERAELAKTRSAREQLKRLDARLGKGVGAKRERAKLAKALSGKGGKHG